MMLEIFNKIPKYLLQHTTLFLIRKLRIYKHRIKIINTPEEHEKLFKFRYKVYCEDVGRETEGVCHTSKTIREEIDNDQSCKNIVAYDRNNNIVAAIRVYTWQAGCLPSHIIKLYNLDSESFLFKEYIIAEISRLMTIKKYRSSILVLSLLAQTFDFSINNNISVFLISCKPGLFNRYRNLGFFSYQKNLIKYPDGIEIPLLGIMDKEFLKKHFRLIHLFYNSHLKANALAEASNLLTQPETVVKTNRILIYDLYENLMKNIIIDFDYPHIKLIHWFIKEGAYLLNIKNSTVLIYKNITEQDIYMILDGGVRLSAENIEKNYPKGCVIGEFAFFLNNKKRTIKVQSDYAKILVLKRNSVLKLANKYPGDFQALCKFLVQNLIYKINPELFEALKN